MDGAEVVDVADVIGVGRTVGECVGMDVGESEVGGVERRNDGELVGTTEGRTVGGGDGGSVDLVGELVVGKGVGASDGT